jgi:hypothetical protein
MTANHFQIHLGRQLGFIERSCRDYDAGHKDEAIRIATSLRVLFYDTNNSKSKSKSLLTHLKAKQIKLLATIADFDSNPVYQLTLGFKGTFGKDDWSAFPLLDRAPSQRFIPYQDWWEKEALFRRMGDFAITRRQLVCSAANQDGGAHVDRELDPQYERVIGGFIKMKFWQNDETTNLPIGEPDVFDVRCTHVAALRQLGYEVLNSPELTNLVGS